MIYPINHDQKVLQQPARPATNPRPPDSPEALVATLTAHQDHCIGMAANMIGFPSHPSSPLASAPLTWRWLNPRLVKKEHPYQTKEGCLSLTGTRSTTRFERITVAYQDLTGAQQELELTGLAAQASPTRSAMHLRGILIITPPP